MGKSVETLIFSKSQALIEKTRRRIAQVDEHEFPSESTKHARKVLLAALHALGDKANWLPMNSEALYSTLIRLQVLLKEIEDSSSTHISWPLVSYCDQLWKKLFPDGKQCIFYSVTTAYNYSISSFTARLRGLLKNVLAQSQIDAICGPQEIYCLQLASLEDENLPLYANIGHEFGHALYWPCAAELNKILSQECNAVILAIFAALQAAQPGQPGQPLAQRLSMRTLFTLRRIAMELFCDLVGAKLVGPAFLLSLHEMSWGANPATWPVMLNPEHSKIVSYPSFQFRIDCLKAWLNVAQFAKDAEKAFPAVVKDEQLKKVGSYFTDIASLHHDDKVLIVPEHDPDAALFQKAFEANLPAVKEALKAFIARCDKEVLAARLPPGDFSPPAADVIAKLLHRLESDILPNIVPDGTLFGAPASLTELLNASALYRIYLLQKNGGTKETEAVYRDIQKIERLTAKALEVSYVQRDFQTWAAEKNKI